ncbi:hypothetical protein [Tenggerimyces flavus]|uniref:Antitoxin n=1 Tax=Tenggerimyces flavus TaxID=1708749 RepID=A0ABV7YEL7_9ACTN|nr:hypothetical protein [Tenggerimyces flavus]MBM7788097.1 hypothetical protein [Tenggerimyces flavus]
MLRVSDETREEVLRIAREDYGGVSADETIRRLIDEHWESMAVAAVREFREDDPRGWADYLAEADQLAGADAAIADGWSGKRE